jgi:hypothetical protein
MVSADIICIKEWGEVSDRTVLMWASSISTHLWVVLFRNEVALLGYPVFWSDSRFRLCSPVSWSDSKFWSMVLTSCRAV